MAADERALADALRVALAPVPVYWGWAPLDTADLPPSLPLVTLQRAFFTTAPYEDMCDEAAYRGDCTLMLHVWALGYEQARDLANQARTVLTTAGGWRLQSESDLYEGAFRARRIEGQWLGAGIPPA